MRIITKNCEQCGEAYSANCGAERFCSNDCMFVAATVPDGDCIIWNRQTDKDGYGVLRLKGRARMKAHRFAYERAFGQVPSGMMVCHRCDRPGCVNHEHLFAGSAMANKADCVAKARHLRGARHHKARLTEADVRTIRASTESGAEIARQYGVTKENVYALRKRQTWKHV